METPTARSNADASTTVLLDWTVLYGDRRSIFRCQAENIALAIEQCENANPGEVVVSASRDVPPQVNDFVVVDLPEGWQFKVDGKMETGPWSVIVNKETGELTPDLMVSEVAMYASRENAQEALEYNVAKEALETEPKVPSSLSNRKNTTVPVFRWDSTRYAGEAPVTKEFTFEVDDQRESGGQMSIAVMSVDGKEDDMLSLAIEINKAPGSEDAVQCAHLHFDNDNLALSIFKQGGKYLLRTEIDVRIRETDAPQGSLDTSPDERYFLVEKQTKRANATYQSATLK